MLPPGILEVGLRFRDNMADVKRQLGGPPRTIEHGDFRVDNLVFGTWEADAPLTVIDWQGVVYGPRRRRCRLPAGVRHEAGATEGQRDGPAKGLPRDLAGMWRWRLRLRTVRPRLDRLVGATARLDFLSSERGRIFVKTLIERFDSVIADHNVVELMRG